MAESKGAEELLEKSGGKFRILFEKSRDPVLLLCGDRYIDCNDAAVRIMGCSNKRELIGLHPSQTSPEQQPDGQYSEAKEKELVARAIKEDGIRFEWVHRKLNGEDFWIDASLVVIPLGGRNIIYSVWRDITEQKRVEDALKRSERRYRRMFDNSPLPGLVFDCDTLAILAANKAATEHYGYTRKEFLEMKITALHPADEVPELLAFLSEPGVAIRKALWRHVKKNKTIIDVEVSGHTLDLPKTGRRIMVQINDITERKQAEEKLRNSYEQLRILSDHIVKVREEERTNIARELHDVLGQLLTTLNMDVSWLKKRVSGMQEPIIEKVDSMSVLVKQAVTTVQKVSSELRPAILADFGIGPAIECGAQAFGRQSGLVVLLHIDPDIKLDDERSVAIFRIFNEALTNIARHAFASTLEVNLSKEENKVVLLVRDNGKGITEEEIANPKSFGILGMKERTRSLEGEFVITGASGGGTTVRVMIPLDQESKSNDQNTNRR
jgi:PAS domain S-box-containing protein